MLTKRSIALALSFLLMTVAAACGSRLSEQQRALAITGASSSGAVVDGSSEPIDVAGEAAGVTPSEVSTPGGTIVAGGVGSAASQGTGGAVTGACTPGSTTSIGVTPTEIKVGNVSQITGLAPGFAQTSVNGTKAYFNMINSQGGVCGRKLTLLTADDRFQAATNRAETEKMAGQVLALVGSLSVVDDGGAPIVDSKGIADISLASTAPRMAATNNFSPNPIDPTPKAGNGLAGILAYFKSTDQISKPAILYQDVATGKNQADSYKNDFERAGIPVVATYPVAVTATNYNTQANDMKQKGIDFVITVAEVNAMANLAKSFQSVGYFPKVPFYGAQVYGQKFLQLAGKAAEGTRVGLIFAIPEDAANNPAMSELATWYARTSPGADLDFFALNAWLAADMFVEALRAAGSDPTQAKIIAHMKTVTDYMGDGLVGGINPSQKKSARCFNVIEVKGGKWVKTFPAKGFQC